MEFRPSINVNFCTIPYFVVFWECRALKEESSYSRLALRARQKLLSWLNAVTLQDEDGQAVKVCFNGCIAHAEIPVFPYTPRPDLQRQGNAETSSYTQECFALRGILTPFHHAEQCDVLIGEADRIE